MSVPAQPRKTARAPEITAALAGRRFGLCGFDVAEAERISTILCGVNSLPAAFHESLLSGFTGACDALLLRLRNIGPEGLRIAATTRTPILVIGAIEAILEGVAGAYSWPRDFISESWSDAELLIRLFRLLEQPDNSSACADPAGRTEPLVLLADDDPAMIVLAETMLRQDRIACRIAANGLDALRLARKLTPDLMVLDVRMPGMNGFEVLETARRDPELQLLPVMLLTSCDDPGDVMRASELGANDYLGKPVNPSALLKRVKQLLLVQGNRNWTRSSPGSPSPGGRMARRWIMSGSPAPESGRQL